MRPCHRHHQIWAFPCPHHCIHTAASPATTAPTAAPMLLPRCSGKGTALVVRAGALWRQQHRQSHSGVDRRGAGLAAAQWWRWGEGWICCLRQIALFYLMKASALDTRLGKAALTKLAFHLCYRCCTGYTIGLPSLQKLECLQTFHYITATPPRETCIKWRGVNPMGN